ncbi:RagB/SusD family nutrient uptake outer membrane protein [Saccharicrinis fermentans]|uniref:SusD family protein n=1 Tax=Saccharicrinis fermentans DSM 9555 = JCM 21142 TaxID=869213 RepID=W7YAT8_9BACT|nr:RagB/SusD family nutrient uptake outer membrane protein [Saccharicrinis fermentans]GAF01471.1 SusD family protein [Saccharicrinis fermentans DSM 9555 = JCM 21142]
MKNKIIYLFTIIVALSSCDLSEEPYGFYSDDNFYKTVEDADAALLYAYRAFNYQGYNRGIIDTGDLPSETMTVKVGEGNGVQELNSWKVNNTNGTLSDFFQYCYIAINRANGVIENVKDESFNQEDKERILGEAYTIRAWSYFSLVRVFGRVPMLKQLVVTEGQTNPVLAEDLDEVYDFILEDLTLAESYLQIGRKVGRFDKVATWAILAKVYLNIASGMDNGAAGYRDMAKDVNAMYNEAALWSAKVLNDQAEYAFDEELSDIYNVEKPDGPEHIWIISMDRTGDNTEEFGSSQLMWLPWGPGVSYYVTNADGVLEPAQNGWEVYRITDDFRSTFDSGDKRMTALMDDTIYDKDGNVIGSVEDGNVPGFFSKKYLDPFFNGNRSSCRPLMIRFTDIALTYAEAVGPTAEGEAWLNRVRARAGVDPVTTGMSTEDFRKAVLQERSWELAFEGHRLYDLRRTASVTSTITAAKVAGVTEDDAAFYPIPLRELDLNPNAR